MDGKDLSRYIDEARKVGATGAKVIHPASVITAPWVRWKCQFGCGGYGGRRIFILIPFIFTCILAISCMYFPDASPKLEKARHIFEGDEKIVLRAIKGVLRDRDFGEAVETDRGLLETDYVVQGDWRTKVVATVKPIGRKKNEVTLSVVTEKKSSSGWVPKSIMGKEQYETFFNEIEIQIYRELATGE